MKPLKRERERDRMERERESERERGWREGERFEDSYDIIPITYPLHPITIPTIYCVYSLLYLFISIILSGLLWTGCELRS